MVFSDPMEQTAPFLCHGLSTPSIWLYFLRVLMTALNCIIYFLG